MRNQHRQDNYKENVPGNQTQEKKDTNPLRLANKRLFPFVHTKFTFFKRKFQNNSWLYIWKSFFKKNLKMSFKFKKWMTSLSREIFFPLTKFQLFSSQMHVQTQLDFQITFFKYHNFLCPIAYLELYLYES